MSVVIAFSDQDLEIEIREPAAPLIRLFKHTGAAFSVPLERYRNGRFDPPPDHRSEFAVLYTADNIAAAAMETRVLCVNTEDEYTYGEATAQPYKVARLQYERPALFIKLDSEVFRSKLGIPRFHANGYLPFQRAALALYQRFGNTFTGFSWNSFHRGQPGRNYGFWHHRKDDVKLRLVQQELNCSSLLQDVDWLQLLEAGHGIRMKPDHAPF